MREVKRLFAAERPVMPARSIRWRRAFCPIALGEATKTVSFAMDGAQTYRFTVRWGEETVDRRSRGAIIAAFRRSARRDEAIDGGAAGLHGTIMQVPPAFSAIKVAGRAGL